MLAKLILLQLMSAFALGQDCLSRDYGNGGTVCVCNSNHCDTVPKPKKLEPSELLIYTSNKAGLRFNLEKTNFKPCAFSDRIVIDPKTKYQTILGWGGAFTDAAGINIASLEESLQTKLLESYFSENGLEYSLCRVPIGGTDFSVRAYSYDDGKEDKDLTNFKLAEEDHKYKIPYIKKALELTENRLKLFASAWTAPKWMKTDGQYAGLGGSLKKEMYQTWVDYFIKFFDSYKEQGISFWGVTTGNEPSLAISPTNRINNVGWGPKNMGTWVRDNLGPTIRNSAYSDMKIMILDDQRSLLPWYADEVLKDNTVRKYVDGVAVHWYHNIWPLFWPASVLTFTHWHFPEKFILATEACNGVGEESVVLGSWERGEKYSYDIIKDLQNWVTGWIDWNMVLDLSGGPTYISNNVDAPIIVNASAGEFYKQPMYYHLGHFSKFVPPNSVLIKTSFANKDLLTVGFQRPDNATVLVILNKTGKTIPVNVVDPNKGVAQVEIKARSIVTVFYYSQNYK
ncbi:lysosomal acid glucosylceramidase [Tribolium castaneum]|uniref:Glucosylceramidase n=1 Tax=Tribolium castaneum TaxID=7070 RepID=D6WRR4_TRICA|nr:PREDICTED: glucosylceramidase [Tribolium castaneum]EFA05963.2 Glucosylceramidase-like Protein [Tribolium castaneum]|eukprot:XP_975649.1 PREDICTED: glucosylceramidase [Tribolium castaneum]